MAGTREVMGGPKKQGAGEKLAYYISSTAPWGSNPTNALFSAFKETANGLVDVSSTVLSGDPIIQGDKITSPIVQNICSQCAYRIFFTFSSGGNTFKGYFRVEGEV